MSDAGGATSGDVVSYSPQPARRGAARTVSWWAKAWLRAVEESAYDAADLRAGRSLARAGAVGGISLGPGQAVAAVGDSSGRSSGLWTVEARLPVLDEASQETLVEVVAAESGRVGALLDGDLPHPLVEHAEEAGVELLPYGAELATSCTCEPWLDPCPHAVAVLHQVAWLLDGDPLVLLHLRGLPRERLLSRLHEHTTARSVPVAPDDEDSLDEVALDTALDAALRARQVLDLLEESDDLAIDRLF